MTRKTPSHEHLNCVPTAKTKTSLTRTMGGVCCMCVASFLAGWQLQTMQEAEAQAVDLTMAVRDVTTLLHQESSKDVLINRLSEYMFCPPEQPY